MIEKPDLSDAAIAAALRDDYGLAVESLAFLQLGNDAYAWVYKVGTQGGTFFLKVRKGAINQASLSVPRFLNDQGIRQVVAPLPTNEGKLWAAVGVFALIVYPFIEGRMGAQGGLSDAQWQEMGVVMKQIHTLPLSADLRAQLRSETFSSKWAIIARRIQSGIMQTDYAGESEAATAALWREKQAEIQRILDRAVYLGDVLRGQSLDFALCHADIHTHNVLVDEMGRLFIVDWDETLLAPKERDLMFIGDGLPDHAERDRRLEWFYKGYGKTDVNRVASVYYRYAWVVDEFGSYGEQILLTPDAGAETKKTALQYFRDLFAPGDVVDKAYQSEADLPAEFLTTLKEN